jgi:hypothetical protein
MSEDLVRKMRFLVSLNEPSHGGPYAGSAATTFVETMTQAADEIERLRADLADQNRRAHLWFDKWTELRGRPAMINTSDCHYCVHAEIGKDGSAACSAFPGGIPEPILRGDVKHDQPYPGDHGILFEPVVASGPGAGSGGAGDPAVGLPDAEGAPRPGAGPYPEADRAIPAL